MAGPDFRTSFEPGDPAPLPTSRRAPLVARVGDGPAAGATHRRRAGFTGVHALGFAGARDAAGPVTHVLFRDLGIEVGPRTRLSYLVLPDLRGDLRYPSTYVALDLAFTDGTFLSDLPAVDAHGTRAAARAQGDGKILYPDQWNSVRVDVGAVAAGRTVDAVLLRCDPPEEMPDAAFSGWVDDVVLTAEPASPPEGPGVGLVDLVDTRRGTMSSGQFSRGNNAPATAVPNGFTLWVPMTDAGSRRWLYEYHRANDPRNRPVLQGFGISHQPSPWMGDRNQLVVQPASGPAVPTAALAARGLPFDHAHETARPDLYTVTFEDGTTLAATPTDHGGVLRFGFPAAAGPGHVLLDAVATEAGAALLTVHDDGTVTGWVDDGSPLSVGRSRMFVAGAFDRAPSAVGAAAGDRRHARYATFDTSGGSTVELRLATSYLSLDQARRALDQELAGRSFAEVQDAARALWEERLGVVEVVGATQDQRVTLYSNLYRLNLYPTSHTENVGTVGEPVLRYASPVAPATGPSTGTTTGAAVVDGRMMVNHGFWDTYRTAWPALALLYPGLTAELGDGFVQQYRDGGWISRWSSPGYADLMTGTSSDVALADAYLKGALPTDVALDAYEAALRNATVAPPHDAVGRKGLETSAFAGFTAATTHESVSWGLEGCLNDFGTGTMAAALADDPATPDDRRAALREESAYLLDRSVQYGALFDQEVGFFRARRADGAFTPAARDFDPDDWGGPFTETNAWNFAFHAPHDPRGLANLYGGPAGLEARLDEFFSRPEDGTHVGGYGQVIHEMTEARDVRLGMWGVSNQPSHHVPWLYTAVGAPWKAQRILREALRRLFVGSEIGQGYPGDEDNGEMSAWWLFAALGLYPLQVGSPRYAVGSPLFDEVTIHRPDGDLVVRAHGNSLENVYVQSLAVDGEPRDAAWLAHEDLTGGAVVELVMGPEPSAWGTGPDAAPPSLTVGDAPPAPLADVTDGGTVRVDDGGTTAEGARLVDDTSATAHVFTTRTPVLTWAGDGSRPVVARYTLTSGPGGAAPSAWRLEGSDDGATWTTLDERTGERFRWARQTRPFAVAHPRPCSRLRVVVTGALGEGPLTLAQLELLAPVTAP
ncbi:GH92 family glycosyl hydrolase [Isoptericola sp. 4D.3]|uniref:GH92 family glycosyl hydrolase n=1 Tax=Isoptericola peretonis TaxID=2918523 RepID=A0ABT0J491_9MICO|nr:GH92 family glycosyl hydrolase [Isoptericola sp. 4D.3]